MSRSGCPQADPAADDLPGDEEGGDAGDPAEDAERDGLGAQRRVAVASTLLGLHVDERETLGQHALAPLTRRPARYRFPPCSVSALSMSLLQQARSLLVRAGVNSMIACAVGVVLVLEQRGRLPAADPDQLDAWRAGAAGMAWFGVMLPDYVCALVSHPTGIPRPGDTRVPWHWPRP